MENRNWHQNERRKHTHGYDKCKTCAKSTDEFRTYEGIISAALVLLSLFSGLLIQLLVYRIFDIRLQEVPTVLLIVLWIGFSAVVTHIINSLDL